MPGSRNNSLKNPEMYEDLRDDGASRAYLGNAACRKYQLDEEQQLNRRVDGRVLLLWRMNCGT